MPRRRRRQGGGPAPATNSVESTHVTTVVILTVEVVMTP